MPASQRLFQLLVQEYVSFHHACATKTHVHVRKFFCLYVCMYRYSHVCACVSLICCLCCEYCFGARRYNMQCRKLDNENAGSEGESGSEGEWEVRRSMTRMTLVHVS